MNEPIHIRTVTVELLRSGPPHNQLLSPLTHYLGVCGDSGAGIVTLPYEQRTFERRLRYLRYEADVEDSERRALLHDTGVEMAKILGSVPGLPGALTTNSQQNGTLIHLRLMLSASELALLPFELAKVPVTASASTESWLALQTHVPVCVTRRIRTVPTDRVPWPANPRVLFVAGDPTDIPFEDHRKVLLRAIEPYRYPQKDDAQTSNKGRREQFGNLLTILRDATYEDVERECAEGCYTHVHILAHGAIDETTEGRSFGLRLKDRNQDPDVVSGERFACALCSLASGRIHRPAVVTVASCDSGNEGSVTTPGAGFAHTLHQAGITLVVGSQFPLSEEGSIAMTKTLYRGLLRGHNPWRLLHRVRSELHGRYTSHSHDWASLVVYEALPTNFSEQAYELRYQQSRRAVEAALERADVAASNGISEEERREFVERIETARNDLPREGPYTTECLGLRASSYKRQAFAEFKRAVSGPQNEDVAGLLSSSYELLELALIDYREAAGGLMTRLSEPLHRSASLHWVLTQKLSLSVVLGRKLGAEFEEEWKTAKLSAQLHLEHPDKTQRAWAHGSLAELWLLDLATGKKYAPERSLSAKEARRHADDLVKLFPGRRALPVTLTARQFARYREWWGDSRFSDGLATLGTPRDPSCWGVDGGILEVAESLVSILQRTNGFARVPTPAAPPARKPSPRTRKTSGARRRTKSRRSSLGIRSGSPVFCVEMLPAGHGDCLWIEYGDAGDPSRILIDCGTKGTYQRLRAHVAARLEKSRRLELFVLTHIDADHIGGAIPFLKNSRKLGLEFDDVWFNGWKHLPSRKLGAKDGEVFSTLIQDLELPWNAWRDNAPVVVGKKGEPLPARVLPGGMKLTLLSPTRDKLAKLRTRWQQELRRHGLTPGSKRDFRRFLSGTRSASADVDALAATPFDPDSGAPNGSSIAVLAEFEGKSVLLAGDAHVPVLLAGIKKLLQERGEKKLRVDAFKVSHHASQRNLSRELLEVLDCNRYLVSTDGSHFHHPDREAIARIIKSGPRPDLFFNYRSDDNKVWARRALQDKYGYRAHYPDDGKAGMRLSI